MPNDRDFFNKADKLFLEPVDSTVPDFKLLVAATSTCQPEDIRKLERRFDSELIDLTAAGRSLSQPCHSRILDLCQTRGFDGVAILGNLPNASPQLKRLACHSLSDSKLLGISAECSGLLLNMESLAKRSICCTEDVLTGLQDAGATCTTAPTVQRSRNLISYRVDWPGFIDSMEQAARGRAFARHIGFSNWFDARIQAIVHPLPACNRDDSASEVRIRVIEKLSSRYGESVDRERMRSPGFWYQAMTNECRTIERRRRVRHCHPLFEADFNLHTVNQSDWSEAERLLVLTSINCFPSNMEAERAIILYSFLEGHTYQQIAAELDVSTRTISRLRRKGLRVLEQIMTERLRMT